MKKSILFLFVLLLTICTFGTSLSVSAENEIRVYLDNEALTFDVPPIVQNGRTLVPMRAIFEKLGAKVDWNAETKTATAARGTVDISITVGSENMFSTDHTTNSVNTYKLDVPAVILNNRTMIPLRAVSEAFSCTVGWDGTDRTISIIDKDETLFMLYAPNGRSRAFKSNEICAQLATGWFLDSDLTYCGEHVWQDSNFYCYFCGKTEPPVLFMTDDDKRVAGNVQYIGERKLWYDTETNCYILAFSLFDETQTKDLTVPAVVRVWIENKNEEIVYDRTLTVSSENYGWWDSDYASNYRCTLYINKDVLFYGTSDSGTLYFNVFNDGYFSFDTYALEIDQLPTDGTHIDLPETPILVGNYTVDDILDSEYIITDISYDVNGTCVYLYFTGEKTYDIHGNGYAQSCKIGWQLVESDGSIADSGTFYSPNIAVGERFKNQLDISDGFITAGKSYTLKILDIELNP